MNTRFLFPHKCKIYGWVIFLISFIYGILTITLNIFQIDFKMPVFAIVYDYPDRSIFGERRYFGITHEHGMVLILGVLFIVGGLLVAFSKEKIEDEFIAKLRLESLVWATFINYILLMLAIIFVYGISFQWIMLYGMFTVLILFIIRFNFILWKTKRESRNAK